MRWVEELISVCYKKEEVKKKLLRENAAQISKI